MEINGLPLHPLVVHATVVFVPLAAMLVGAFAVGRRYRWLTRWPAAAATATALVVTFLARISGESLLEARPELAKLVQVHQERAGVMLWFVIALSVLTAVSVWALPGPSGLASGKGARESRFALLELVLPALLVLTAVGVLVTVVLTGDAGSRAVWG